MQYADYSHTCIYILSYIYMYIYSYVCYTQRMYMYTCLHTYNTCTVHNTHIYNIKVIYIYVYMCMCVHVYIHTLHTHTLCTYKCIYMYIHHMCSHTAHITYSNMHIYGHIYIHTGRVREKF